MIKFNNAEESHAHSLKVLETLYEFDDFMESVSTMVDMGCGAGLDLEWWATRTTRDDTPKPLNIRCYGIDQQESLSVAKRVKNVYYRPQNFEEPIQEPKENEKYDVVWSHDSFQHCVNPLATLANWWHSMSPDGMLCIVVPQTTNLDNNDQNFDSYDGCYYHWTVTTLIYALAVNGFDCRGGFLNKQPQDPWIYAMVYKSEHAPMDPRKTKWFDLMEKNLIPESAVQSFTKYGYVRQKDLVLTWLDRSLTWLGQH
jgi:SAM-dependent methyltransferase